MEPCSWEAALHRLYPPADAATIDPEAVYRNLGLPDDVPGRPYVIMNMVSTVDGKSTLGQTAAGIGSKTDWLMMRQIRAAVDAIMVGAGTLRAEPVDPRVDVPGVQERLRRGQPAQPVAVAVSGSLQLEPTHRFLVNGPTGTVILTTAAAPPDRAARLARYATIVTVDAGPDAMVDLEAGLRHLWSAFGVRWLLSEGGPSLNQRLLDAGLIDEVFWTIAPKLAGGRSHNLIDGPQPTERIRARMELRSLHEQDGEMFVRYRLLRNADGGYQS
jgi:riboflavin-specific deaminase-like protein